MSAIGLEAFLARLYTDAALRESFLSSPRAACSGADLNPAEIEALVRIDRDGLILAARSIGGKRDARRRPRTPSRWRWRRA